MVRRVAKGGTAEGGLGAYFQDAAAFHDKIARLVDVILGVKGDDLIRAD